MIKAYTVGNGLYGLPYDINSAVMFYNKSLFDEAGVKYPDNTWTYDDLYKNLKTGVTALAAKGKKVWGISAPINTGWSGMSFFYGMGTPIVTDDGKIGVNDNTVKGLNLWMKMMDEGLIPMPDPASPQKVITAGSTTFVNGQAMVLFNYTNTAPLDAAKMNYGVAPLPIGTDGKRGVLVGGGYVISGTTKNPKEAYSLLNFYTSSDSIKSFVIDAGSGIPARTSLFNSLSGVKKDLASCITGEGYSWQPVVQGTAQIWTLKDSILSQMWIKQLTPEQVVTQLQKQGTDALQNAKN